MEETKRETGLAPFIKDLTAYNLWANKTIIEWLKTKPEDKMEQEVPSSFTSIRATYTHMCHTEAFWLSVVKETLPPQSEEFKNINALFNSVIKTSEEFYKYTDSLNETDIIKTCYLDTPWVKGERPKYEFIQHIMNHSTYHRGQIVTIGRNTGITDAPMTDYNYYNFLGR